MTDVPYRQVLGSHRVDPSSNDRLHRASIADRPAHPAKRATASNTRAGEGDETGGQRFEHLIVALGGRGLGVLGPVGLEDDLRDFVVIGPTGRDAAAAPYPALRIWSAARSINLSAVLSLTDPARVYLSID